MTVLTEQERILGTEQTLLNSSAMYGYTSGTLTLLHDYGNITMPADGLLIFKYDLYPAQLGQGNCYACLKIGTLKAHACNAPAITPQASYGGVMWLAAGTYDIQLYGEANGQQCYAGNLQIGTLQLLDQGGQPLATYSSTISYNMPSRATPLGNLKNAVYAIQVCAYTPSAATSFENPGDNYTNGVDITVDGVQQSWSERFNDGDSAQAGSAKLFIPLSIGVNHTVTITKDNSNTVVNISLVVTPWIMSGQAYTPIDCSFSQGSTVYMSLEPLFIDTIKFAGVGQTRAISFGSASDYYNSQSAGSGLMMYSYVLDVVDVTEDVYVYGLGGCIGLIAVDVR